VVAGVSLDAKITESLGAWFCQQKWPPSVKAMMNFEFALKKEIAMT
jgi:hypothetical protein